MYEGAGGNTGLGIASQGVLETSIVCFRLHWLCKFSLNIFCCHIYIYIDKRVRPQVLKILVTAPVRNSKARFTKLHG